MSDRSNNPNRPLKPSLASNRTARTPVTPRVAPNNATFPSIKSATSQSTPSIRSEPLGPRVKQTSTPVNDALANGNITPRSSARASKPGSANASPSSTQRPKSVVLGSGGKLSSGGSAQDAGQAGRLKSIIATNGRTQSPLIRSPGLFHLSPPATDVGANPQFFLASDGPKQEHEVRKTEPPKKAQFFHADGKEDAGQPTLETASPVLSAVSEQRSTGLWMRLDDKPLSPLSPPILSPALSAISNTSPFFAAGSVQSGKQPSPSQSKENIHLSYRKGASQIFGTRPAARPRSFVSISEDNHGTENRERMGTLELSILGVTRHHKSPSLSSIDSGPSPPSRRVSSAAIEVEPRPSSLGQDAKMASIPHSPRLPLDLPSIDTSLESPGPLLRTESGLSPTKLGMDLAADARRERKVLDLEISNSSLLAINASLEREVRRQKTELKRFRRLSLAGRFSFAPGDRRRIVSDDLTALEEEDEDGENDDMFGLPSGFSNQDDFSDDEESVTSSSGPLSPSAQERLAKDERRLQMDLERHKELLSQSQAMNQSIKRCMYATEDMIKEGRKALEYHVRVSDVKLGGRVLSTNEDGDGEQEIEVEVSDALVQNDQLEQARGFLENWAGMGTRSFDGSEVGDRDSGIEVERPRNPSRSPTRQAVGEASPSRPTTLRDMGKFGSFS